MLCLAFTLWIVLCPYSACLSMLQYKLWLVWGQKKPHYLFISGECWFFFSHVSAFYFACCVIFFLIIFSRPSSWKRNEWMLCDNTTAEACWLLYMYILVYFSNWWVDGHLLHEQNLPLGSKRFWFLQFLHSNGIWEREKVLCWASLVAVGTTSLLPTLARAW